MAGKLYVYDRSDWPDRMQANGRFTKGLFGPESVRTVAVGSKRDLIAELDGLVRGGAVFDRALFQTRGYPGAIRLGDDFVNGPELARSFGNHWRLFPGSHTRIYFDGSDVARGADGWSFLIAAGQTFLRAGGGQTLGFTNGGLAIPGRVPLVGGHTIHGLGDLRVVQFGPGGLVMGQPATPMEALVERMGKTATTTAEAVGRWIR